MKYSVNNYVEAFYQVFSGVSAGEKNKTYDSFLRLLKKTGDIKNSKKILEALHRKIVNDKGGRWIIVEAARELGEARSKSLKKHFSEKDHVEFKINPDLVAGVRITINGEQELDNSLNSKLNKLLK